MSPILPLLWNICSSSSFFPPSIIFYPLFLNLFSLFESSTAGFQDLMVAIIFKFPSVTEKATCYFNNLAFLVTFLNLALWQRNDCVTSEAQKTKQENQGKPWFSWSRKTSQKLRTENTSLWHVGRRRTEVPCCVPGCAHSWDDSILLQSPAWEGERISFRNKGVLLP